MSHQKQFHSPAQIIIELTPEYPNSQAFLYEDSDLAQVAFEHLLYNYHMLRNQPAMSNDVWLTFKCDDYVVLQDTSGGVSVLIIMAKTFESCEEAVNRLRKANIQGDRLAGWYTPEGHITERAAPTDLQAAA